jgi:hypothetical protein
MKHFFTLLCLGIFTISLQAQDLIVTNDGDSLNCKITKVKTDNIYFTFKYEGEIRNTLIPVAQVTHYKFDYYQEAEVPIAKGYKIYPRFRVELNGGWNYRIAKISENVPSDLTSYIRKLMSGFHVGAGLTYYFSEYFGGGVKYNNYWSSNKINNVQVTYLDGTTDFGNISDDIHVTFIGPVFSTRLFNSKKTNCILLNLAVGYVEYKDKGVLASKNIEIEGSTVGACMDVGYDIGISKNWALGIQVSLMSGVISQVKYSDGRQTQTIKLDNNQRENLARIELSIGLRFNK